VTASTVVRVATVPAVRVVVAVLALLALPACGNDDDESTAAFCRQVQRVRPVERDLADSVAGRDPAAGRRRLAASLVQLDRLARHAPDGIHDDVRVVARVVRQYRDALAGTDPDDPVATTKALQAFEDDRQETEEASGRLRAYVHDECGLNLNGRRPTTTPSTTAVG
jgi:hypothetical protein